MIGRTLWIAVTILATATRATAVEAEEIRVLSPVAMRAAMPQIAA